MQLWEKGFDTFREVRHNGSAIAVCHWLMIQRLELWIVNSCDTYT